MTKEERQAATNEEQAKEFAFELAMDFACAGIVVGLLIGFVSRWIVYG